MRVQKKPFTDVETVEREKVQIILFKISGAITL